MTRFRSTLVLGVLCLAAAGCKAKPIPRSTPPWMTIGATKFTVMALDTARIGRGANTRDVWLRVETHADTTGGKPAMPPTHVDTHHRVNCGTRVVEDLDPSGAPAARHPFDTHPMGKRVFATVCNAIGALPAR